MTSEGRQDARPRNREPQARAVNWQSQDLTPSFPRPIEVVPDDRLARVPPGGDMIDAPGKRES
jgi:hypothetical protein